MERGRYHALTFRLLSREDMTPAGGKTMDKGS
jgi:hypothetical protein